MILSVLWSALTCAIFKEAYPVGTCCPLGRSCSECSLRGGIPCRNMSLFRTILPNVFVQKGILPEHAVSTDYMLQRVLSACSNRCTIKMRLAKLYAPTGIFCLSYCYVTERYPRNYMLQPVLSACSNRCAIKCDSPNYALQPESSASAIATSPNVILETTCSSRNLRPAAPSCA